MHPDLADYPEVRNAPMKQWKSALFVAFIFIISLTACEPSPSSSQGGASRLDTVKNRGKLICGIDGSLPGFSFVDETGNYSGIDVDVCRAVAAALFDDPNAVEYRSLNATERFTALSGGEVDILSRNTTWTISRDTALGMEFAPTIFYDGQGVMTRKNSGITSVQNLAGKTLCLEAGTTTELNLTDKLREVGVKPEILTFQTSDPTYAAYAQQRCDAVTADKSKLMARRSTLPQPDDHVILEITLSKEPLGPVTINNDSRWFDVVKWSVFTLIEAEELGITQGNLEESKQSENVNIRRFLGLEEDLGAGLGLSRDFTERIIKHVGNYQDVYDRNLGEQSVFKLPRGQNELWSRGGLLYSPPFR